MGRGNPRLEGQAEAELPQFGHLDQRLSAPSAQHGHGQTAHAEIIKQEQKISYHNQIRHQTDQRRDTELAHGLQNSHKGVGKTGADHHGKKDSCQFHGQPLDLGRQLRCQKIHQRRGKCHTHGGKHRRNKENQIHIGCRVPHSGLLPFPHQEIAEHGNKGGGHHPADDEIKNQNRQAAGGFVGHRRGGHAVSVGHESVPEKSQCLGSKDDHSHHGSRAQKAVFLLFSHNLTASQEVYLILP